MKDIINIVESNMKKKWTIQRSYLGQFTCEDAINKIIQSHMNMEEDKNV